MHISFVTLGLPFNGNTVKEQSLGGSETALLSMAQELAKRGHKVRVFCQCETPGVFDGVVYYKHEDFLGTAAFMPCDVLVCSRWPEFLTAPNDAKHRVLWLHDMPTDKNRIMAAMWQCDQIYCLSDYHSEQYTDESFLPELLGKISRTTNGVDLEQCVRQNRDAERRQKNKIIFTSRPERGLAFLMSTVMPLIWEERPDVELHFANYDLKGLQLPQEVTQTIDFCNKFAAAHPDQIKPLGHLTKDRLYEEIGSSMLHVYPTEFPEISCITAMEAPACGTPIITTDAFALHETVEDGVSGILIPGLPSDGQYARYFADTVLRLLGDGKQITPEWMELHRNGPESVKRRRLTWALVAEQWESDWNAMFLERSDNAGAIAEELVRTNDLIGARRVSPPNSVQRANIERRIELTRTASRTLEPGQVIEGYKEWMPIWEQHSSLLAQASSGPPRKMFTYEPTDVAYCVAIRQQVPEIEITICTRDADTAKHILQHFATNGWELPTVAKWRRLEEMPVGSYDLVHLGPHVLDMSDNPARELKAAQRMCSSDGWVAWTSGYGTKHHVYPLNVDHQRIQNLSFMDYSEMFPRDLGLKATFHADPNSDANAIRGIWILALPKAAEVKDIDYSQRIRTRPYESITCCMILKDDLDYLPVVLKSIRPYVDEFRVVVDTRTDPENLEEIERHFSKWDVRFTTHEFDNFGEQRNVSIGRIDSELGPVRTGWLLWVDADERLVGGDKMRKYVMGAPFYDGFTIAQRHLMLDLHGTYDTPIRLLRNKPHFKFVGLIHEHCEDTSKGPFDNPIHPAMMIPDVDLAHYGYLNERQRRRKCSNRNMELLQRDLTENPTRRLNKVLALRDHMNIVKWASEGKPPLQSTKDPRYPHLVAAVDLFHTHFAEEDDKYRELAFPMYQEALMALGKSFQPLPGEKHPPLEAGVVLTGAVGGLETTECALKRYWFPNNDAFLRHMERAMREMLVSMGCATAEQYAESNARSAFPEQYAAGSLSQEMLARGVGVVPNDDRV